MVVFTIKNTMTNEVFVGSTRQSVDEYWGQLIVKAEENGTGDILDSIRNNGSDVFELETWGYSDSSAETRELVSDACETLNASVIKTGRSAVVSAPKEQEDAPSRQAGSTQDYQEIKDLMVKIELKRKGNRKTASTISSSASKTSSSKAASNSSATSSSATLAKPVTESATRKTPVTGRSGSTSKHTKAVQTNTSTAKDKLPEGRVSSSTKEKRIREAIAKEKMERDAKKAAQVAAEADEMAAIMAKLDAKTKEKAKFLRRR